MTDDTKPLLGDCDVSVSGRSPVSGSVAYQQLRLRRDVLCLLQTSDDPCLVHNGVGRTDTASEVEFEFLDRKCLGNQVESGICG